MTAPLSTDEATALLTSILMDPQWSVDSIADLPKDDPFGKLCYDLAEIRAHVQALSKGDLSRGSKARGFVAGSLKATEANLRHLTWQMERVAQGDYSQSVSFMGDFSKAFNKMSREMHSKAEELSRLLERYRMSTPMLKEFADRECRDITVQDDDKQFVVDFYKYALVGVVLEWIRRDMKTEPAVMVERMGRMLQGDLRRALCRLASNKIHLEQDG